MENLITVEMAETFKGHSHLDKVNSVQVKVENYSLMFADMYNIIAAQEEILNTLSANSDRSEGAVIAGIAASLKIVRQMIPLNTGDFLDMMQDKLYPNTTQREREL